MKTILFALLTITGCSILQPAKEPAKEVWYAAELLCAQDLTQYAEIQAITGAAQLIQEVCSSVAVADPYVDALLKQNRGRDPLAQPRANAVAAFKARRGQS